VKEMVFQAIRDGKENDLLEMGVTKEKIEKYRRKMKKKNFKENFSQRLQHTYEESASEDEYEVVEHGNFRKRKAIAVDYDDDDFEQFMPKRKRRKMTAKQQEKKENELKFNDERDDRTAPLLSLAIQTNTPKKKKKLKRAGLKNVLQNLKKTAFTPQKNSPGTAAEPHKIEPSKKVRMRKFGVFNIDESGKQVDIKLTEKLDRTMEDAGKKKTKKVLNAVQRRNKERRRLALDIAKRRRIELRKHRREFGREEAYMLTAEDEMLAETMISSKATEDSSTQKPEETEGAEGQTQTQRMVVKFGDDSDSSDGEDLYNKPSENVTENSKETKTSAANESKMEETETSSDQKTNEKDEKPADEDSDLEDIDLDKILAMPASERDAEDEALLRIMGHGETNIPDEIKKFIDDEAHEADEEGVISEKPQDEHEAKYGVVKNLLATKKIVETNEQLAERREFVSYQQQAEDAKEQRDFEKVFIEGRSDLLKGRGGKNRLNDDRMDKKFSFLSRDVMLAENPEDYLVSDEEMNEDCYDEDGLFLPVWKIRLNRERRRKIEGIGDDYFSGSDDDTMSQLPKEERIKLQRKKLQRKLTGQKTKQSRKRDLTSRFFGEDSKPDEEKDEQEKKSLVRMKKPRLTLKRKKSSRTFTESLGDSLDDLLTKYKGADISSGSRGYIFNAAKRTPVKPVISRVKSIAEKKIKRSPFLLNKLAAKKEPPQLRKELSASYDFKIMDSLPDMEDEF